MKAMKKFWQALGRLSKVLLFIPPVLLGGLALYFGLQNTNKPERIPEQEQTRVLRVIKVPELDVTPRAIGYGTSQPAKEWEGIAEVSGRIVELHPQLEAGTFFDSGELLVRIDTIDILLAIDRLGAKIESSEASMSELAAKKTNFSESLKIAKQSLAISESELARDIRLVTLGAGSLDEVDSRKRNVNTERNSVQNIVNDLNLLPSQIKLAEAAIRVAKSNLAEQKRDLDRCKIMAPFACRLGPVDLEIGEFIASGTSLLMVQSTDCLEVEAQFTPRNLRRVIQPEKRKETAKDDDRTVSREMLKRIFNVTASVRYGAAGVRTRRAAVFERIREELDSQARTVGVVVSMDKPYANRGSTSHNAPPPVSGTYCEVELRAPVIKDALVIPRSAIVDDFVYVLDSNNRLRQRKIKIRFHQGRITVIESGLSSSDVVIVSDPTPAIPGMLVSPVFDDATIQMLGISSTGEPGQ